MSSTMYFTLCCKSHNSTELCLSLPLASPDSASDMQITGEVHQKMTGGHETGEQSNFLHKSATHGACLTRRLG